MFSMVRILRTCFFVLWISSSFAQVSKKDSLVNELEKATQDTSKIKLLLSLSFDLRASEPARALEYATTSLKLSKKIYDRKKEAKSHNNIGLAYFYQSQYDSAIAHYENSLKIGISTSDSSAISLAYSQLGNTYKALSNFPISIEYHKKALRIRENTKDTFLIVQSYSNLGNTYVKTGQYELASKYFFQALEILKNKKQTSEYVNTLGGLGNTFMRQKNYRKAIDYFQMCYRYNNELKDERILNATLLNLGSTYTLLGKHDSALFFLKQNIKINEKAKNKQRLADAYITIASVYKHTEQVYEAKKHLLKALDIYAELKLNEEYIRTLLDLSEIFLLSGDKTNGRYYLNESLSHIDSMQNANIVADHYLSVARCYNLMGKYSEAYNYLSKGFELKDSMQTTGGIQAIAQMHSAFDFKVKENEIELLNREKEISNYKIGQQQTIIFFLVIGAVIFILLVFFVFRGYQKARKANLALSSANLEINEKNKNISDSINYAKNIQNALLTVPKGFKEKFKDDYFILYKPKDVVSGDFYWIEYHDRHLLIAAADCTGHGVPGSLVSMLGFEKLKQAVHEKMLVRPNKILSFTNKSFIETFSLNEATTTLRDGMDIALCSINIANNELYFAGANRPLWIITQNDKGEKEIKTLDATKTAIGGFTEKEQEFDLINYSPKKGDIIYLFTDGYTDQFGGERNKKYTIKRFRELLLSIAHLPLPEQREKLESEFTSWKSVNEQVDDVLVIGFKIA